MYKYSAKKQLSLINLFNDVSFTVENELMSVGEIEALLRGYIFRMDRDVGIKKFIAGFISEFGLLCKFEVIYSMLKDFEKRGLIYVERDPAFTKRGVKSVFWEVNKVNKIKIRSLK